MSDFPSNNNTKQMAESKNTCGVCQHPAAHSCSACNTIFYCSKDHQKQHWKQHKPECVPFKILSNETLGRYPVATRDIPEGTTIMRTKPLIIGPKTMSYPLCLGCHKKLNMINMRKCSKCDWPLCSEDCEESKLHKQECVVFAQNNFRPEVRFDDNKQTAYSCITPLRCLLLKEYDKNKYNTLMSCQSHLEEGLQTPMYQLLRRILVPIFLQKLKINSDEEEIMKICSILDTNCFDVRDEEGKVNVRALYSPVNLIAHDCKPNTKHSFHGENFEILLISTMPIKAEEEITATYTQTLWGTLARRAHLRLAKHFDCTCKRCSDATEFGTYAGSFFCSECRETDPSEDCPKIVSTDPLDEDAVWSCPECEYEVSAEEMNWGNEALKMEIRGIDKSDPRNLEEFLVRYQDTLHAKNCHVLEVKYALTQMYGNMEGFRLHEITDELIERKIQLCRELLEIADILEPGLSRFRGYLLHDLQAAMVVQAKRDYANGKMTKKAFQDVLMQAMDAFEKSRKILITEPNMENILEERSLELKKVLEF